MSSGVTFSDRGRAARVRALLIDNPLARAQERQLRRLGMGRKPRFVLAFALTIGLGTICMLLIGQSATLSSALGIREGGLLRTLRDLLQFAIIIAGITLLVQGGTISGAASRLATTTLARERQSRTWEPLILTGISAPRIVLGKWFTVVRLVWAQHIAGVLVRPLVGLWLLLARYQVDVAVNQSGYLSVRPLTVDPLLTLLTCVLMIIAPLLFVPLTAAIGMFASSLTGTEIGAQRLSGAMGFSVVLLYVGVIIVVIIFSPVIIIDDDTVSAVLLLAGIFLTPGDLGAFGLVVSSSEEFIAAGGSYLIGFGVWCVLAAAATALLLMGAVWASWRGGASGGLAGALPDR